MRITNCRGLPYGIYITAACVVAFDRDYRPIVSLPWTHIEVPSGRLILDPSRATVVPAETRINFESRRFFYRDGNSPAFDRHTRAKLKRLVENLPTLKSELVRRKAVRA